MKRHSFFLRLFLGNLLVVALLLALGGALFYEYVIDDYRVGLRAHQRADAAIMVEFFQRDWPLEPSQIDRICKQLGQGRDVRERMRITFVAADGAVLGDSEADPASMSNHKTPDRPEVLDALDGREGADTRASRTLGTHLSYLAKPVRHNGQVVGAVRLAVPAQLIVEQQRLTRHALAWFALAAAALAVALAGLLAWLWYAPLKHLTASAGQIASGDLSLRVRARGPKELAHLGEALNQMRQSLAQQIELIEHQRHDLQTVIASLDEGVIALDARGRIVLMNRAAGELFGVDHAAATGQWLQSIVSRPIVIDAYNQVVSGGKPAPRQMEIERQGQRRIVEILAARPSTLRRTQSRPESDRGATNSGAPLSPGAPRSRGDSPAIAGLLVFRDVTDLARTALVKAEFVANASHELRTPLATIRAAVDSLATIGTEDSEAFKKFVGVLDRQAARLEELTNDLLNLHLIERKESSLNLAELSLRELADWVLGCFSAPAREKGLTLNVTAPGDAGLKTDRKLLEMILRNLLDNAVKFTPAGGKVELSMCREDDGIHFAVSDTGCGIGKDDLPRVFERFYQTDAARSGDVRSRGTGLGLAIVKHAAERLGAKVNLASELGRGTTVTVVLPGQ